MAGGWHWPYDFYWMMARQHGHADLHVVAHRNPELAIVETERQKIEHDPRNDDLTELDRMLYREPVTLDKLAAEGWQYTEAPNTAGDQVFLNQWLDRHDYRDYDAVLSCHDDTFVRRLDLYEQLAGGWLLLANGSHPQAPPGYFRGSFEFWSRELLDMLGGYIPVGEHGLTREGETVTPAGRATLAPWNKIGEPVWEILAETGRLRSLSPHYRVSRWMIEGERGRVANRGHGSWSLDAGLAAYPL